MNRTIAFAGNELKKYTEKFQIDISKISLKRDPAKFGLNDNERDAYDISIKGFCGEITGNNDRSVLLGVYRYLSETGFVFARPGKNGTLYPETLKSDVFISKISDVKYRGISFSTGIKLDALLDIIDFLPKLGYNTFFFEFPDSGYYFAKEYGADFAKEQAGNLRETAKSELKRRDMIIQTCGHGWTSKIVSELLGIENASGFEKSDCERENSLIAMIGGKRKIFNSMPAHTHLCYSNPEVIKMLTNEVFDYCKRHTDEKYVHIWLADYFNNFCECENCVTGVPQKFYQILLGEIDKRLSENGIDTKIIFLIYFDLLFKPERLFVNPERFILLYCPFSRDTSKSFAELNFDKETPYPPFSYNHNEPWIGNDELYSHLKEWEKEFKGEKILFDYPYFDTVFSDFSGMQTAVNSFNDAKTVKRMNLDGYISCHNMKSFFPHVFGLYVLGKTLFDNNADYDEEKKRYFSAVRGLELFETAGKYIPLSYMKKQSKQIDGATAENAAALRAAAKTAVYAENDDCFFKIWTELMILLADVVYEKASGNESGALNARSEFSKKLNEYEPLIGEIYDVEFVDNLILNFVKEGW